MYSFWKYIFPSVFWMGVMVFALFGKFSKALLPDMSLSYIDKLVHFFLFFVLGGCYYWTLQYILKKTPLYAWRSLYVMIAGGLMAGGTELVQEYFLSHRRGEWSDFYSDMLGVVMGTLLFQRILLRRIRRLV